MEKAHVFMLKYPAMKIRGPRGGGGVSTTMDLQTQMAQGSIKDVILR